MKTGRFFSILKSAAAYFGLVFGAGFVLGPIRILWLVPRVGERWAELLEMPLMLAATILAARWIVRRFALPPNLETRLGVGLLALSFLLAVEFTVVLKLRGLTLAEYFASRDPVSGTVYYLMLGVFAVLPAMIARRRPAESQGREK